MPLIIASAPALVVSSTGRAHELSAALRTLRRRFYHSLRRARAASLPPVRRRAAGYGAGTWGLPGGFVEYDEDFLAGARREVREESGLDVTIDAIVNVTSNLLRPQLHTIAIVVLAHPVGGAEMPGDDLDLLEWFDRHRELPPLAFDADAHIIQVWKERGLAQIPVGPPA